MGTLYTDRLAALRDFARLSQSEFAKRIGCHPNSVGNWETGKEEPKGGYKLRVDAFIELWEKQYNEWKKSIQDD